MVDELIKFNLWLTWCRYVWEAGLNTLMGRILAKQHDLPKSAAKLICIVTIDKSSKNRDLCFMIGVIIIMSLF